MASEARLYTVDPAQLKSFRLKSNKLLNLQAMVYAINPKTLHIDLVDDEIYTDLEALIEDLPSTTPRFILVNVPLVTADGRKTNKYVVAYWGPHTKPEVAMMYAAAKEKFRVESGAQSIVDCRNGDELLALEKTLGGK